MKLLNFLKRFNWPLFLPAVFLSVLGALSIYSSSFYKGDFLDFKKQLIFLGLAICLSLAISFLDLRGFKSNSHLVLALYFVSLMLLLGLSFFGQEIRGVRGWYKLGPVSFDPVPFAALVLIIVLAKYFSTRHIELKRFQPIVFSAVYALLPILLILLQPDLGSALTILAIWLGMIIFSGIRLRHLAVLAFIFLILLGLSWQFWFEDYHKQRILSFLNPEIDKQGIAWSANQSKIAIGSGGFFGKGFGKGSQTQYGFLSEVKTDFVFASLAEEFGFLAIFLLLAGFLLLFRQIVKIAFLTDNNFSKLFAQGFAFLILAQSGINIGMCLGLFPVVGIPLPFVSYGGSQLLAFYLGLGILMSLERS